METVGQKPEAVDKRLSDKDAELAELREKIAKMNEILKSAKERYSHEVTNYAGFAKKKDEALKEAQATIKRMEKMLESRDIQNLNFQKELADLKKGQSEAQKREEVKAGAGASQKPREMNERVEAQIVMLNEALARKTRQVQEMEMKFAAHIKQAKADREQQDVDLAALKKELERLRKSPGH